MSRNCPVQVGSSPSCPLQVRMRGDAGLFLATGQTGLSFYMQMKAGTVGEINGEQLESVRAIEPGREHLIIVKDGMFVVYWTENEAEGWALMGQYDNRKWYLYGNAVQQWEGPYDLATIVADPGMERLYTWGMFAGMRGGVCRLKTLRRIMQGIVQQMPSAGMQSPPIAVASNPNVGAAQAYSTMGTNNPASGSQPAVKTMPEPTPQASEEIPPDESVGEFTCPVCWLKFDAGDVMSIASHPDLIGDPVLGRDQMQRFLATRFNSVGQALDEKGMPCPDVACPHCRCKLPPAFLESREHIFSVIGAPAAGKSYYLASLVHEMESVLARRFGAAWRDADPTGNSMLNDVTYRLFNANSPEEAYLSKTDLDGALYSEFRRHGRMVKLPKPFVYVISSLKDPKKITSLIFYDNAGEHFEPGRNTEDSPGARHVSVADGLFFLFDPTTSAPFRRKIGENTDPQLASDAPKRMDQQNIIMTETAVRISTILNLSPGQRINKPLAVMLGKCDLWLDKLGGKLQSIYTDDGRVDHERVDANSKILREFMMEMVPSLCTSAESLSSCVRYFAVSPLGCSPVKFFDAASNSTKIGPDPMKITPQGVCDPTLWVLSLLEPDIVPFI